MIFFARSKDEQNLAVLDPWSVVHLAAGLAAGLVRMPLSESMIAAGIYEVAEQMMERSELGQEAFETSGPESLGNVVADLGLFALGHWLGTRWNEG